MNWISTRGLLQGIVICFAVALCPAADVKTYPAKGVDVARYKTYQWLPTKVLGKTGIIEDDPTIGPLMRQAVNKQLAAKGLTEVNGPAELQVSILGVREASAQLEALIFSSIPDAEWGTAPIATVGRYNYEGALVVNLIDTATKKTAWAGIARKAIKRSGATSADIEKVAGALFKKYPN